MESYHSVSVVSLLQRMNHIRTQSIHAFIMYINSINTILFHNVSTLLKTFIVLFIMLFPSLASAADVVVVQSIRIKPYNDVLKGFKDTCNCSVEHIVLSELGRSNLRRKINKTRSSLVLTIGMDAYRKSRASNSLPTIYTMILDPLKTVSSTASTTGISMSISPERQLNTLKEALPGINKIGLLYDPARSGKFVKQALLDSKTAGIELIAKEVHSSKDVPDATKEIKDTVDALWMLPDLTVVTPETFKFMLLSSYQSNIPLISFSAKYVEMGALLSLNIDEYDIGRQAGEMAVKFFTGTTLDQIEQTDARSTRLTINKTTAKKLGIPINNKTLNEARIIGK